MKAKKAQSVAWIWLFAMVMILFVGILFVALSVPHEKIKDTFTPLLSGDYLATFNRIVAFWYIWPILFLVGVIIWMYMSTLIPRPQ